MISLRGLSLAYPPPAAGLGQRTVLEALDLELGGGQVLLLLGASGSGKTSLCQLLAGLAPRLTGGWARGLARVAGLDPLTAPAAEMALKVQIVFQDPEACLFNMVVLEEVLFSLEVAGRPYGEALPAAREMLTRVGLAGFEERAVSGLSGGEKARLALACALAPRPEVLLVDEALSDVDPDGRTALLRLLRQAADGGAAVILTQGEAEVPAGVVDRVAVMAGGRVVELDHPDAVLTRPDRLAAHGVRPPQLAELGSALGQRFWELEGASSALARWGA